MSDRPSCGKVEPAATGALQRALTRGGVGVFAVNTAGVAAALGAKLVIARTIGPEELGRYSYAMSAQLGQGRQAIGT